MLDIMMIHQIKKDLKFGDNVRISKYKNIFAKGYTPNWSEVFINKIKNTVPWTYAISDLNGEEITVSFYEKELQKIRKKKQKKYLKEKVINYMSNGKGIVIHLIVGLIKKTLCMSKRHQLQATYKKMNKYFPKSFRSFAKSINVKVDL